MAITHSEAQEWIHLESDASLTTDQKKALEAHMVVCSECRMYANGIRGMENVLRPLLQRQWRQQPVPLPIGSLLRNRNNKLSNSTLLATRIAAISVMLLAFMVSTWRLASSNPDIPNPVLANIPSMPIPSTSTQLTSTRTGFEGCNTISYVVTKNDTLARVAYEYSISVEEIMRMNALNDETLYTGQILSVPSCDSTPTGTIHPQTTTLTPYLHTITSTPGG